MRILVVEDNASTRVVLCALIGQLGHDPVDCETGEEALELLESYANEGEPIRLCLLDWMLPGMSGLQVLKKIREDQNLLETYVIMQTIKSNSDAVVEGLDAGANDYVTKPYEANILKARINIGIRQLELQEELRELQGLLTLCSWCTDVIIDPKNSESIELYLSKHSNLKLSHGICSRCVNDKTKVKKAA